MTNRALVLGALADGRTILEGALFSDDTRLMAGALRALGLGVNEDERAEEFTVAGQGGRIPVTQATVNSGNAGTVARFLTAVVALGYGRYVVDGSARMRERPIGDLVGALRTLGVDARAPSGCPPVYIQSRGLPGGRASLRGEVSSQFLSALLLAAPCADARLEVTVEGKLVGAPYVDMTAAMMADFGVAVEREAHRWFAASPQRYEPRTYRVETDASSASYFFAAAALTGGRVRVPGLHRGSMQGDLHFVNVLEQMGCQVEWAADAVEVGGPERLRGIDVDLGGMSDMTMTLAAMAPFAEGPVRIRGVRHVRAQESDRLSALATELRRLGQGVEEADDGLEILPRPLKPAIVQTYNDHRIAMAFAVTGLRAEGVALDHPECVVKTFPDFFERLDRLVKAAR